MTHVEKSVTRQLAAYAIEGGYETLSAEVIAATKLAVLNIIAAALGGTQTNIGQLHVRMARQTGAGVNAATVWGDGERIAVPMATYANASLAFALDYEDVVCYCIHAGPVTVPAALAVGESLHASGREVLVAIERGYEIGTRIGLAMQPSAARGAQVWGQQYTPFAPCVAAGRLLGLGAEQMDVAMGITGTYALVPSAYKYFGKVAETRPMREAKLGWGWMALGGVFGALCAAEGFAGGHGILDGEEGFWIMAGSDQCDHDSMVRDLGRTHYILETEFKVHPSIAWNHPPHLAIKRLMHSEGFAATDVRRVQVRGLGAERIADHKPAGPVDAMFSLPYTIATTLRGDALLPAMYSPTYIRDPELAELMRGVEITADATAELAWFEEQRMCFAIAIDLQDGRRVEVETEFPRDKPAITWPEIEKKFRDLAATVLPRARIEQVIELVADLDKIEDIAQLTSALRPA